MLISKSKKFIYIHVDRTGGTTFSKAFKKYTWFQWSHRLHQLCLTLFGEIPYFHLLKEQTALELRSKLSLEQYNQFFKFAMIRNPWEWMVSDYSYRQQYKLATNHSLVKGMTFEEFVKWKLIENYHEIDPLECNRGLSAKFTDEKGNVIVDYVGRFESFEKEFNFFCKKIDVKASLSRLNNSHFSAYQSFYTKKTCELVAKYFSLDIERYGYTFN